MNQIEYISSANSTIQETCYQLVDSYRQVTGLLLKREQFIGQNGQVMYNQFVPLPFFQDCSKKLTTTVMLLLTNLEIQLIEDPSFSLSLDATALIGTIVFCLFYANFQTRREKLSDSLRRSCSSLCRNVDSCLTPREKNSSKHSL
jgi:hypothetical protein